MLSFPPSLFCARESVTIRKKNSLEGKQLSYLAGLERDAGAGMEPKPEVVKRLRSSICELLTAVTWSLLSQLHSASSAAEQQRGSGSEVARVGQCVSGRLVALVGNCCHHLSFRDVFTENVGKKQDFCFDSTSFDDRCPL